MRRNVNYKEDLLADIRNDLGFAAEYLSAAYIDSREAFLVALRDVVEARQGMAQFAAQTKLNREHLYRTLSEEGNPRYNTLRSVLEALGVAISFTVPASGQISSTTRNTSDLTTTAIEARSIFISTAAAPGFSFFVDNSIYECPKEQIGIIDQGAAPVWQQGGTAESVPLGGSNAE